MKRKYSKKKIRKIAETTPGKRRRKKNNSSFNNIFT
jgi:hypothetical protein